jgi:hypothetical protein
MEAESMTRFEDIYPSDRPDPEGNEELAWAAGVFEATGTATRSSGSPMLNLKQRQDDDGSTPELLTRFHAAVGGLGRIGGPYASGGLGRASLMMWYCSGDQARKVVEVLWPWLGERRRAQWLAADPREA